MHSLYFTGLNHLRFPATLPVENIGSQVTEKVKSNEEQFIQCFTQSTKKIQTLKQGMT